MMLKRILIIGSATALAALVLVLAMRTDPATKPAERKTIDGPMDPSVFTGIDPAAGDSQFNPRGRADKYRINRYSDSGQLIELYGDRIKPLPKGVAEVTAPGARIHLEPHRVLQITAEHGTIVAPDNQPQSGRFTGNVVITLYESDPSRPIDLSPNSPDMALRANLGNSRFDLDLGMIESSDQVHVTSSQLDFRGTGLTLSYNERRRRIDRLEIHQGRSLRFKPDAWDQERPNSKRRDDQRTTKTPPEDDQQRPRAQLYKASFTKRVSIRSPQAQIDADRFDVMFTFRANPPQGQDTAGASIMPTAPSIIPLLNHPHTLSAFALSAAATAQTGLTDTMAEVAPDDIIITWSGPLVVQPYLDEQEALQDPSAVLVELAGSPLRIQTPDEDVITAAKLDYLTTDGRMHAYADSNHPVEISSSSLGRLTAHQVDIDRSNSVGRITGPGKLVSNQRHDDNHDNPAGALGGLAISWRDELDLAFASSDITKPDTDTFAGIAALDSAAFHGQVHVNSNELDLNCDALAVKLDNPHALPVAPKSIDAQGNVHLTARDPADPDNPLAVASQTLRIALKRDADQQAQPDWILATGSVTAEHTGRRIHTERLQLALHNTVDHDQPATAIRSFTADQGVRIHIDEPGIYVVAKRLVADLEADQIELFAKARPLPDQFMTVTDTPADPLTDWPIQGLSLGDHEPYSPSMIHTAQIAFPQGSLQAEYIVMHQHSQSLHIPGPGTLSLRTDVNRDDQNDDRPGQTNDEKPSPDTPSLIEKAIAASREADTAPAHADLPVIERAIASNHSTRHTIQTPHNLEDNSQSPAAVTLTWMQAMHLDNRTGIAHFVGDVHTRSRSDEGTTELSAQDLRLEFTRVPESPNAKHAPTTDTPATPVDRLVHGNTTIRTATAREDVTLLTQRVNKNNPGQIVTRLRLQGPHLAFDHTSEQAQVLGPGTLLFEDYREPGRSSINPKLAGSGQRIHMTGRGPTLFRWNRQMTIDAFHNDINLLGQVQMVHHPDGGDPVQLDCRRLLADLKPTGGLPSWLAGRPQQPAIQTIHADSDVRLSTAQRTVRTDHLIYTGYDNNVLLRALPGRLTTLHENNEPYAHTAQSFKWDLDTDRIEINKPTSSWVPMRSSRRN